MLSKAEAKCVKEKKSLHIIGGSPNSIDECHIRATSQGCLYRAPHGQRQTHEKYIEFEGIHQEKWSCAYLIPWQRELGGIK